MEKKQFGLHKGHATGGHNEVLQHVLETIRTVLRGERQIPATGIDGDGDHVYEGLLKSRALSWRHQ